MGTTGVRASTGQRSLLAAVLIAIAPCASLSCASVGVADLAPAFPTRRHTLPSGLRVVIEDDPSASIVGAVCVVEAGAIDDPPDRYGLAHAVEHLVFATPDAPGV